MPKKTVWFSPRKIIPSIPEADRPVIEKVGFQFWPKDQALQCLYKALGRDTKSLKPETIRELRNYIDRISRNALPVGDFYVVQFLQELYDRGGKATIDELPKVTLTAIEPDGNARIAGGPAAKADTATSSQRKAGNS